MATGNGNVEMMVSVLPGTMTGFAALNAGLASINNSFLLMTSAISENFGLVDTAILTTGVVVAQFAADAMSAFADFEQSMKIVQLVSGQTADQIQYLGQKANEFAVQYRTDIDSITEGLQTLGRAGLNSATEQTEVLQNGLSTSKLEGRELNSVLQELIQNTALLGGNLKSDQFGEQSQYVNDLLVATSLSAPINTHDISETLKYSGGIAAAAGANIESDEGKKILEDYMGAIAAFAQKGVTGSIAGTALRAFFNKPATQDSSVVEALSSIGLSPESLWEDGGERMKPVSEQIAIIKGQMDKLNVSTMDQLQIWSKIVGGKMGQQMMKLESDDIKTLTSDIREAESAESLANESMNTFKMNINEMTQEGQRAFRNYGSTLVWALSPAIEVLKQIVYLLDNPVLTSALAIGTLGFFRAFISRARQVIGGFKQGLQNVWNDYASNNRLSISQYRGESKGARKSSDSSTIQLGTSRTSSDMDPSKFKSEKSFMQAWSQNKDWKAFQEGKLSADQFGFIKKTQNWKESSELAQMARDGHITQEMYNDIKNKMTKAPFMDKHGDTLRQIYTDNYLTSSKEESDAKKEETRANKENTDSVKQSTENVKKSAENHSIYGKNLDQTIKNAAKGAEVVKLQSQLTHEQTHEDLKAKQAEVESEITANEEILSNHNTTKQAEVESEIIANEQIITNWNAMCASLVANLGLVRTDIIGLGLMPGRNPMLTAKEIADAEHQAAAAAITQAVAHDARNNQIGSKNRPDQIEDKILHQSKEGLLKQSEMTNKSGLPNRVAPITKNDLNIVNQNARDGVTKAIADRSKNPYGVGTHPTPAQAAEQARVAQAEKEAAIKQAEVGYEEEIRLLDQERLQIEQEILAIEGHKVRTSNKEGGYGQNKLINSRDDINRIREQSHQQHAEAEAARTAQKNWNAVEEGRKRVADIDEKTAKANQEATQKMVDKGIIGGRAHDGKVFTQRGSLSSQSSGLVGITSREDINKIRDSTREQHQAAKKQTDAVRETLRHRSEARMSQKPGNYAFDSALGKYGHSVGQQDFARTQEMSQILKDNKDVLNRVQNNPRYSYTPPTILSNSERLGKAAGQAADKVKNFGSTFKSNFISYIDRDRTGRMLGFANKGLGKWTNRLLNATDVMGGPFMVAMMAITLIMQGIQNMYQEHVKKMQELSEKVDKAYDKLNQAEQGLREAHESQYPGASKDEIDAMVYDTYEQINNDIANAVNNGMESWIEKAAPSAASLPEYEEDEEGNLKQKEKGEQSYEDAVNENTKALYQAIFELQNATSKYVTEATDGLWGVDGVSTAVSDFSGYLFDAVSTLGGSNFEDKNEFLLTASQKDENYPFSKEMAGLMIEDFKDAGGDWIAGLRTMMGKNVDDFAQIIPQATQDFLDTEAKAMSRMGAGNSARLQTSMKRDKKTWQALAKEIAKEERKRGKPIGSDSTGNKKLEGLVSKLNASMGNNFNRTQILQAAYLQQAEDMYAIAQQVFTPLLQQNANSAAGIWQQSMGINSGTSNTVGNTGGTVQVASSIAAMVAIIAKQSAKGAFYDTALSFDPSKKNNPNYEQDKHLYELAQQSQNADDFYKKVLDEYNTSGQGSLQGAFLAAEFGLGSGGVSGMATSLAGYIGAASSGQLPKGDSYGVDKFAEIYEAQAKQTVYGYNAKDAMDRAAQDVKAMRERGMSHQDMLIDIAKNYQDPRFLGAIEAAYEASGVGEDQDSGSSGGSGGSGGDDSDDSNKGTKKERVDLVLCNKKEIPKLNVNLFKKPPSFTVLNKNFKLRDIKVNTQDKPKAVLSSIKNAIIDVQKRSDPKIIQDESAEYDPVSATEGSSVPSGSTNTGTD